MTPICAWLQSIETTATRSGKYVIAEVTDPKFFPGKVIPPDYQDSTFAGSWFFWPHEWLDPKEGFGGVTFARLRGYPMAYSPGFASCADALAAAEKWESEEPERQGLKKKYDDFVRSI